MFTCQIYLQQMPELSEFFTHSAHWEGLADLEFTNFNPILFDGGLKFDVSRPSKVLLDKYKAIALNYVTSNLLNIRLPK